MPLTKKSKMLPFLILLLILPSLNDAIYDGKTVYNQIPPKILQNMISQACANVEDEVNCLSNVESRLPNGPRNASSVLRAALEASLNEVQQAIRKVSDFSSLSSSTAREQIAVEDCKELLDYSVTELAWSLSEMREIRVSGSVHDPRGDLQAWLSAAVSNQDTCLEGFEGTNQHTRNYIKGSLTQVTQLISNVLTLYTQLHVLPFRPPRHKSHNNGYNNNNDTRKINDQDNFPQWMTEGDKELIVSSSPSKGMHVDAVVSTDGSGKYRSINEAIDDAPNHSNRRYVIYVKKGVYNENIDMKKKKTNIMMIGDGIGNTVISGNRNFMQGWTTFRSATFAVSGKGFIAKDITFRNTAGPKNNQAVALRVDSDQSAFYRCSMEGYQDTLYAHSLRQFYRDCNIYGTIDFIFGNGAAVIQNCNIYSRTPLPLQKVTITAQGRKSPHQSTGFSIQSSFIYANQPAYLGRPWKPFSRVVYLNTYLSAMIQPKGWLEWYGNYGLNTLYYGEYRNYGPGASVAGRVKWPGFHILRDASEAMFFTVGQFIDGMSWLPETGVKFSAGLTN
ncbi:putative pectinesterase/pectinesterase inhibitor 22 [Chenopodium quinoa]|uniref:putative pectinesterase/pectinesterase inhibitor 22 n=1 Tax=Chenopodium quinoa TaxID=63459 RepID=UPI000B776A92|nr:putative pectinesterase/pectinesterase inhibitor 22 [Chenopodium quinoa]